MKKVSAMKANTFNRILVATDYTDLAENAVRTAASICRKHKATLILLHVVKFAPVDRTPEEYHLILDYTTEMKQAAKLELKHLGDRIRETYRIPVDEIVTYGEVPKEIARISHEMKPDLVVLGTHGASGFREWFIGTTAYRVIKHTKAAVLTIPGTGDWTTFRSVLFPMRLVPHDMEKYDHLRPILLQDHSILHVLGLSMEGEDERMSEVFDLEEQLEQRLEEDGVSFDVTYHHCRHYADEILKAAKEKEAGLVVITTSLDKHVSEFFVGPYSQQVINHAKVPVLAIRSE